MNNMETIIKKLKREKLNNIEALKRVYKIPKEILNIVFDIFLIVMSVRMIWWS